MKPARELEARYAGTCADCGRPIAVGEPITYRRPDAVHRACTLPDAPTTTHRERLEARADRREAWASSRAGKAADAIGRGSQMLDAIPFGQPVHGARDANFRARARDAIGRGVAHENAARTHASKAAGIEAQLRASIYDDDPDAVEQLTAKLARLEAERERWKAYNAACRKAKGATVEALALLDDSQRAAMASAARHGMSFTKNGQAPAYHVTNLGGNITRLRQRIERLSR